MIQKHKQYFLQHKREPGRSGVVRVHGTGFLYDGHVTVTADHNDRRSLGWEDIPNRYIGLNQKEWLFKELA